MIWRSGVFCLALAAIIVGLPPTVCGVSCDCSMLDEPERPELPSIEDWGDDSPDWTQQRESFYHGDDLSRERFVLFKAGSEQLVSQPYPEGDAGQAKERDSDILRMYIERSDSYADRDPIWNESDPYIRFFVRGPGGSEWIYLGSSDVVEGCNGSDCDAVFEWTMDYDVGRSGLWDVGPELWDDDGGWSDDELLGYKNYYQVAYPGMELNWRLWDDDGEWHCYTKLSVEYIDNGVDDPSWVSYPTGEVTSAQFEWALPDDRSGFDHTELHLSEDDDFGIADPYVYEVTGSSFEISCGGIQPADGTYYFAIKLHDGAGNTSAFISPHTSFDFECATPTPMPTATPTATTTITPTRTPLPTWSPGPTFTPDPSSTDTPIPAPTSTPSPTGTPEPTPDDLWYDLQLTDDLLEQGDRFDLVKYWGNPHPQPVSVDEYIILDVFGQYWFWPSWSQNPDMVTRILPSRHDDTVSILQFDWPDVDGSLLGIKFWGAFLEPGSTELIAYDMIEWGYQ